MSHEKNNGEVTNFQMLRAAKGLKVVHMNIRSIHPKIDQLRATLTSSTIDIISISETWLHPNLPMSMVDIPGYKAVRLDRKTSPTHKRKKGGGLLIYVTNKLAAGLVQLENLNTLNGDLESQWIEIERDHAKNIVKGNIYRPPAGQLTNALALLNKNIGTLDLTKKEIYLLGNFNINYKNKSSPAYKKLFFFPKS